MNHGLNNIKHNHTLNNKNENKDRIGDSGSNAYDKISSQCKEKGGVYGDEALNVSLKLTQLSLIGMEKEETDDNTTNIVIYVSN